MSLTVKAGIEAKVGASEIIEIRVDAGLSAKFNGTATMMYDHEHGPGSEPKIEWEGLKGAISCKTKGNGWFDWFESEHSAEIALIKGGSIWEPGPIWWWDSASSTSGESSGAAHE